MKHFFSIILLFVSVYCFAQDEEPQEEEKPAATAPVLTKEEQARAKREARFEVKTEPLFNPMLIFGMNAAQVWGDQLTGYRRIGANAGAGVAIRLPKHFSVSFEILYSMKGSVSGPSEEVNIPGDTTPYYKSKLVLDYIDVPVMVRWQDKRIAIFGVGMNYSSLVRYKELRNGSEYTYRDNQGTDVNPYRVANLEFLADVTFVFAKHYGVNLRYNMSVLNINSKPITYSPAKNQSQQSNYLTLRFMYYFR